MHRQHAPVVARLRTPGRGRRYLAVGTPQPMPQSARRGGLEAIGQAALPGSGRSAHAGAGGGTLDRPLAPAVTGLRTLGRS